ncbi:MAG: glycosyltransferase family 2 protein [Anaerolineaceae bacterium]
MMIDSQPVRNELITVLIPAHNEADNIDRIVRTASNFIPVWVVDDGSTDFTADLAEKAGAVVFRQRPNQGKGAALRFGFQQAIQSGCKGLITLDGDGQHDPEEIPAFLAELEKSQVDLIIGSRQFSEMPLLRRVGNSIGRILFSAALGQKVQDNQSGYRYISRRLMQAALLSSHPGFEFEVEMIAICTHRSFLLKEIPIKTIYYEEGKSHIKPWKHAVGFFKLLWQTARYTHPEEDVPFPEETSEIKSESFEMKGKNP